MRLTTLLLGLAVSANCLADLPDDLGRSSFLHFIHEAGPSRSKAWLSDMDLGVAIDAAGFSIGGPIGNQKWSTRFDVIGTRRTHSAIDGWHPRPARQLMDTVEWVSAGMTAQYVIGSKGLRQNFLLQRRPAGMGPLQVVMSVTTPLCPEMEGTTGCAFRSAEGELLHAYRDLLVWDACGTKLPAHMRWDEPTASLALVVDDTEAQYPITIDPVSTGPDRVLTPPNAGKFGWSVANAGDLNGDGYSDVVAGAYTAASGEAAEGMVYVYYGSSAGIPAAPSVTLQVDQAGAQFGISVDGAGDVNGDGYSDLIVGANGWESSVARDREGAVFIYHGSATGIPNAPSQTILGNVSLRRLGSTVAGLGDINGDGFSDIAIGSALAANGQTNEGLVWIHLGSATGIVTPQRHLLERSQTAAQFGLGVAPAGDVNGDGYNDVIIGAHKFEFTPGCPDAGCDDGLIAIYHGSANALGAGANPAPASLFNTIGFSVRTGWAVSTAGDVNADGYSDVIIGDWRDSVGTSFYEGTAFVFHGSAAGIVTVPATILQPNLTQCYFGQSVSTAGDINGDGYADVMVGAIQFSNGHLNEGATFVYLGGVTGVSSSSFLRYESNTINGQMGESVSTAGDVNGDGYSDMVVGIPNAERVQVYHGGTYNVSTSPAFTRASGSTNALLGAATANAGDVNGDGYSDAIFGAPGASNGQANEGLAFVHYGSPGGLSPLPSVTLETNVAGAAFGTSVASAGDINGDGYSDVLVGAPLSSGTGAVYLFSGSPAGLSTSPSTVLTGSSGSRFGASVFKAGDVNADGYSDVVIGAPGEEMAYVFLGRPAGLVTTPKVALPAPFPGGAFGSAVSTAGDVNGDGFSDIVIGAPEVSNGQSFEGAVYVYHGTLFEIDPTPAFAFESNFADRRLGSSVAGVGDVNANGYYEIAVGAPGTSAPEVNEGAIYVFYATSAGTTATGHAVLGSNLSGARLGTSVGEAGDVNGDGYADIIGGAPNSTNGENNEGRAWVFLGSPGPLVSFTTLEMNIADELFGSAVAGGGDVDGDGYSDVMVGAPNASPTLTNEGRVFLHRGNNGLSANRLTRQYQTDLVSPLATNSADMTDEFFFGIGHRARSPIQRTTAKLRWEVVHEGQAFSGAPITNSVGFVANSAAWTDLGLTGFQIKELVAKAPTFFRHKWRVRVEYPIHKMIDGQRFSRWFYGFASAVGDIGVLPVELIAFDGQAITEGNLLSWSTGSEMNSSFFQVERSADASLFSTTGVVDAAGQSSTRLDYTFLDEDAPAGLSYYRLRIVDADGSEGTSTTIAILRETRSIIIFPVPVDDAIHWTTSDQLAVRVIISDALGRMVVDASTTANGVQGRSIQQLASGTYTLALLNADGSIAARSRFLKR